MSTAPNILAMRLALVTSLLEARLAVGAGLDNGTQRAKEHALRAELKKHADDAIPANWLRTRLGLTETEEDVLWILVAAESSASIRGLIAAATGSTQLSLSAVGDLVYGDAPCAHAHRELTKGRLHSLALVQRTDGGDETTPAFQRTLRAHPRIVDLCFGETGVADAFRGLVALSERSIAVDSMVVSDGCVERARAAIRRKDQIVLAIGRRGTGRTSLLHAIAQGEGHRILLVEAAALSSDLENLVGQVRSIARESMLLKASVIVRDIDAVGADALEVLDAELFSKVSEPCMATAGARPARTRWTRPLVHVELSAISGAQREALWKRAIPKATSSDAQYLASTYPFAPSLIDAVGRSLQAVTVDMPTSDQVIACIDAVVDERLGSLADRVFTTQTWEDLVLLEDQHIEVQAIIARVRQRSTVYEGWGFGTKLSKGLAVTALLSGPPGTGKTMLAGLIAKELGLPLYQVDLSKIVSKWIGETEKHLAALFDAAEAGHAVLLFDEADSLFGKRTEVKSSNDRNANLEVNFLLQRIERFTGICFLTTNHESAVDEAFRRRLAFHLRFSIPEAEERAELWKRMLPAAAPVANGIDFELLGRKLSMSGGYIRNAVLRAAFAACDEGAPITMEHLWRSGVAEYEAMGKIASGL